MSDRSARLAARRRLAARLKVHRKALFWTGATLGLAGAATLAFPMVSQVLVGVLAGWLLWFAGAAMILVSLLVRAPGSLFGAVLAGLTAIAGGAFLLFNPMAGALATTVLIAAILIVDGAFELALALDLRPLAAWRWVLASALASGIAGVVVAAGAASWSQGLAALVLGVAFASTGVALMMLSRPSRSGARQPVAGGGSGGRGLSRSPSTSST